jgi:hypothetical protein
LLNRDGICVLNVTKAEISLNASHTSIAHVARHPKKLPELQAHKFMTYDRSFAEEDLLPIVVLRQCLRIASGELKERKISISYIQRLKSRTSGVNTRLKLDCLMANRQRFGRQAIDPIVVMKTWNGQSSSPTDKQKGNTL